jgi:START domain
MKFIIHKLAAVFLLLVIGSSGIGQYNWKLSKDKDGIQVFLSETAHSKFKSIKVECTLEGNYDKLIDALSNVDHFKDWIYKTKTAHLLKKPSANELYYYSETSLPWPMSNRDVVAHVKIQKDNQPGFIKITSVNEPNYLTEMPGKVRVPHLSIDWHVSMPTAKTIHIVYVFEVNPGGDIPAWMVNMFADKGPYETFKKLAVILKK